MDSSEDTALYEQVNEATNELLSIAERYDAEMALDPEHVQRRIPAILAPVLELLSRAGKASIVVVSVGRLPENRVASHISAFGFFKSWLSTESATRVTAMLCGVFESAWKRLTPSTVLPTRLALTTDIYPVNIQAFLHNVAVTHAALANLIELILAYEKLSPPIGEFGVFGLMSRGKVPQSVYIPRRGTSELDPWLFTDLPLGFYSMDAANHHEVNSSAFCQWIKGDPFLDSKTGLHLGGVDGIRWASIVFTRMTHHVRIRVLQREKYKPVPGGLDLQAIQIYVDAGIVACTRQLTISCDRLKSERAAVVVKPEFVTLSAVPSELNDKAIQGVSPAQSSSPPSPDSTTAPIVDLLDSEDDEMSSVPRSSQVSLRPVVPLDNAASTSDRPTITQLFSPADRAEPSAAPPPPTRLAFQVVEPARSFSFGSSSGFSGRPFAFPSSQKPQASSTASRVSTPPVAATPEQEPPAESRITRATQKLKDNIKVKVEKESTVKRERPTRGTKRKKLSDELVETEAPVESNDEDTGSVASGAASTSTPQPPPKQTARRGGGRTGPSAATSRASSKAPRERSVSVNPPPAAPATGLDGGAGLVSARTAVPTGKRTRAAKAKPPKPT